MRGRIPESTIDARPLFEDNTVVFCVTINQAAKERLTDYLGTDGVVHRVALAALRTVSLATHNIDEHTKSLLGKRAARQI